MSPWVCESVCDFVGSWGAYAPKNWGRGQEKASQKGAILATPIKGFQWKLHCIKKQPDEATNMIILC